ncbi:hypothetical protein F2Q68_00016603 [Brassica cretica]|nr:hypothetical protein F2Q68_00016603 [Brassica cretica]
MALFIMKWMDLSLKECRMQGLSFLCASPLFGNCVGRPLSSKVPWTYDSLFSWSKIQFQLLELLHQRSSSMPLLEKGDLSFLRVSLVRGRGFGSSIARGIFALPLVGQIDWSTNCHGCATCELSFMDVEWVATLVQVSYDSIYSSRLRHRFCCLESEAFFIDLEQDINFIVLEQDIEFK